MYKKFEPIPFISHWMLMFPIALTFKSKNKYIRFAGVLLMFPYLITYPVMMPLSWIIGFAAHYIYSHLSYNTQKRIDEKLGD